MHPENTYLKYIMDFYGVPEEHFHKLVIMVVSYVSDIAKMGQQFVGSLEWICQASIRRGKMVWQQVGMLHIENPWCFYQIMWSYCQNFLYNHSPIESMLHARLPQYLYIILYRSIFLVRSPEFVIYFQ